MSARRIKSLAHGIQDASPYEPWHTKVSPNHREHRSKRNQSFKAGVRRKIALQKKRKIEEIRLKELNDEI